MPRPLGRDRLEPTTDGTFVLLSLHPKPWTPRDESGALALSGTAVRWEGELYEVLRMEPREAGGFRSVLLPWDDRQLVRSYVEYSGQESAPAPEKDADAPATAPSAGPAWWARLPRPVRVLVSGFVPAVLLGWFLPFRIMGEGMSFLVHELGHTATAWLFGCTALPAIVMTITFEQVRAAAALIWVGLAAAAVYWRKVPRWNIGLGAAAIVYPFLAFSNAYLLLFDLGGHIGEVLFAAWAFRRALRRDGPEWERPIWSFFAFYLVARNVKLFAGVALSASARTDYLTIAIADRNDLVKAAEKTGLTLEALAGLTAIVFLLVPLVAILASLRAKRLGSAHE